MGNLGLAIMATLVAMGVPLPLPVGADTLTAEDVVGDLEVLWLAKTIQGEGCHLMGERRDEAARWMAWTVFTRVEHPSWPNDVIAVVTQPGAYNGAMAMAIEEPTAWALVQAELYLTLWRGGTMAGAGPPWVLSLQDIQGLGGQVTVQAPLKHIWNGPWHLFFLWNWPEAVGSSGSGSGPELAQ